jgi:hypothetical protein
VRKAASNPVTALWHSARQGRGMILLRGKPDAVQTWAERGLVPVHVVPLDGWTSVVPAGPSRALPPYQDALKVLAGRPVASRLRSAIGLFAIDGKAVVTVHPSGWRAVQRWFFWSPGHGMVRLRQLAAGRPADLVAAAGSHDPSARHGVRELLVDGGGDAYGLLADLMKLLSLPGFDLLYGSRDPATAQASALVEPGERQVARFDRLVSEQARYRAELEVD